MFIHAVLFVVGPKEVAKYRKDSLMWAGVPLNATDTKINMFQYTSGLRNPSTTVLCANTMSGW
jgi:hypothetical protein